METKRHRGRPGAHYSPPRRINREDRKSYQRDSYDIQKSTGPPKRYRRLSNDAPRPSTKHAINPLKSKIRDLTRSLEHNEDLPAGVRVEKERALAGYRQDLEDAESEKRKQALISRYHGVRFIERQKATRHMKKAQKRLEASSPKAPSYHEAQRDVHIAEVDLNYTLYSPLDQKYEGIYSRESRDEKGNLKMKEHGNGGEADIALASRPAMWRIVENCMREGTLEALRNGKLSITISMGNKKPTKAKAHARGPEGGVTVDFGSKPEPTEARKEEEQDSSEESDGGFFEKRGRWDMRKT